jgi:hypothetical protein
VTRPCNKENMRKLVTALRSGEYKQCRSRIRIGDSYCCLGVATDLYHKEREGEWIPCPVDAYGRGEMASTLRPRMNSIMPDRVSAWLGLIGQDGNIFIGPRSDGYQLTASILNDYEGKSFNEIADKIEEEYLSD